MKSNITEGKNQLNNLLKEINLRKEKVSTEGNLYGSTLIDLQIKLDQMKEKQSVLSKKYQQVAKQYEKRKYLLKSLQEQANMKQNSNDTM